MEWHWWYIPIVYVVGFIFLLGPHTLYSAQSQSNWGRADEEEVLGMSMFWPIVILGGVFESRWRLAIIDYYTTGWRLDAIYFLPVVSLLLLWLM